MHRPAIFAAQCSSGLAMPWCAVSYRSVSHSAAPRSMPSLPSLRSLRRQTALACPPRSPHRLPLPIPLVGQHHSSYTTESRTTPGLRHMISLAHYARPRHRRSAPSSELITAHQPTSSSSARLHQHLFTLGPAATAIPSQSRLPPQPLGFQNGHVSAPLTALANHRHEPVTNKAPKRLSSALNALPSPRFAAQRQIKIRRRAPLSPLHAKGIRRDQLSLTALLSLPPRGVRKMLVFCARLLVGRVRGCLF
ncbi:hypothetical protein N431DRAFT_557696 [Stipitochalara longipes BDJ]|nr:hypothetical protein N431DRAFT_557696 [Stipitochalara longipes BDJ]